MKLKYIFILIFINLVSCKQNEPYVPYTYENNPQYTWGYTQFYGKYYKNYGVEKGVHAISLFTKNLQIDSVRGLIGTGQYLELSDVFVNPTDTILPVGTYTLTDTITADNKPFTFLKGKEVKENNGAIPTGAHIYYFERDASKNKVKYITEGSFTVSRQKDDFTIQCNFKTNDKAELKGTFTGNLYHFDQTSVLSGVKRKRSLKFNKH